MVRQVFALCLLSLVLVRVRADLPGNVTKCKLSDPKLNDCIKEQASKVYQNLYEGVEELGIPVIKPVKLSRILLTPNNEFQFDLRNCKGREINKVKITDVKMDTKFQTLDVKFTLPYPSLDCTYRASGKYLNKVYGDRGFINITFGNVVGYYSTDFDSMVLNNSSYYQIKNDVFRFDNDKITIKLSHEDGSDDSQAKEMSKVFSQEGSDFQKEVIPAIKIIFTRLISNVVNKNLATVPADQLFDS